MSPMEKIRNYINGELVEPATGQYLDNIEPATGSVYSKVADSDGRDVERAVAAAREAFPAWSRTPAEERSRLLLKLADGIESNLFRLARAESIDTGKPLLLAKTLDIPRAARNIRFFATAILHQRSEVHPTDYQGLNYTLRRPRGVAGLITPWNLPLYLLTWKVAPAIATGNTAVAKPSELTPMTAFLLAKICREVPLPPGVLNIVHGIGEKAGAAFSHRAVKDGDEIRVGRLVLRVMETPGHTPDSICIQVVDPERSVEPRMVLTGDTLFVGDVGRPDLAGAAGHSPEAMAGMLYDSLHQKLLRLPDAVEVYPAHGAGSLCGRNMSRETSSTIGEQRRSNAALRPMARDDFVRPARSASYGRAWRTFRPALHLEDHRY